MADSDPPIDIAALQRSGLPSWVTRVIHRERVTSTMDVAREVARAGPEAAVLIIAEAQTAGRGRRGAPWIATRRRGLTFTLLLTPEGGAGPPGLLSLASALSVRAAVAEYCGDAVRTKWPNDVLVSGRKIAGVLIEALPGSGPPGAMSVGIGINVNQTREDLSTIRDRPATSLAIETGRCHDRTTVLWRVLSAFGGLVDSGRRPLNDRVIQQWRSADVCLGAKLRVRAEGREFGAVGRGITDEGLLVVNGEDNATRALASGEVQVVVDHSL